VNSKPAISVIIPVYNAEKYLTEAIESVLAQKTRPLEVIVVDDGSTDSSPDVAERFGPPVKCLRKENAGAPSARNAGIEITQGDFFAFLDADDYWAENKLELQLKAFDENPTADLIFGHVSQFHSPDMPQELKSRLTYHAKQMPGYLIGAMLAKRKSFKKIGFMSTEFITGDFIDWYLRAIDKELESIMLPEVVLRRRLHADNLGVRRRDLRSEYALIVKANLDRKRKKQKN